MAELPKSWGLSESLNQNGKVEITGKDDAGSTYLVRTCDSGHLTDRDVQELHAADRETYSNPETRTRDFIEQLVGPSKEALPPQETAMSFDDSEWIEAALPVVEAGFGQRSWGYSRRYAENFDQAFKGN